MNVLDYVTTNRAIKRSKTKAAPVARTEKDALGRTITIYKPWKKETTKCSKGS